MAALPVKPEIARAFGGRVIAGAGLHGPASHDHCGVRYVFAGGDPGWRYALDVERRDTAPDPALAAVLVAIADAPPLRTWTLIEVVAKLLNRPAHLVLGDAKAGGLKQVLAAGRVEIAHPPAPDHWISVGRAVISR